MASLTLGTRGSRLALRQADIVRDALTAAHPSLEIKVVEIRTEGDVSSAPLSEIGGLGVFTKAIEDALLDRRIDVAVHSLKDLPPAPTPGLLIAAIPQRGDPRDGLVTRDGRKLADLPAGARIGTGSARRAVQLLALNPHVVPQEIRGNVDTRVRKVDEGEYDGAMLALAGLARLGLEARTTQIFAVDEMIPAVGQACLAVQARDDDPRTAELVRAIDDAPSHTAADCERAFLATLGAGCRMPVGAFAELSSGKLLLRAMLQADDGAIVREQREGRAAASAAIGRELAQSMLSRAVGETPHER